VAEILTSRRAFAGLALSPALASRAHAQPGGDLSSRAVTLVVPFPPGGLGDLAARPVAMQMARSLGIGVPVLNRSGGGGTVGTASVARAAPDGHTLLMTVSSLPVLPEADRLNGRPAGYELSDFAPIARVAADPTVLAVPTSAPWRSVQDLILAARQSPETIPYGSSGNYGTVHVAMEMFALAAGIRLLHVPFQGAGPAVTALLSGTVQASAVAPGVAHAHAAEGRLRVLANWGRQRLPAFPDAPTFRELGLTEAEFYIWAGLFAPRGLPGPVSLRLREAAREAILSPETARVLDAAGTPVAYQDAPEFAAFVAEDAARVVPVVRRIGRVE